MSESSICLRMAETESADLKEVLHTQQRLLQNLYSELEEEREASATATSEALSMILRLQREKAAEKMEASQYKREAEEKLQHSEESLAVFEDLMYQKDMEISFLEFQIRSYKHKLLRMCLCGPGIGEIRFPENLFLQRNEALFGDMRRNKSLPALQYLPSKKGRIEREGSAIPLAEFMPKIDEDLDCEFDVQGEEMPKNVVESSVGDFNSYLQQIKPLEEQVKELSHGKEFSRGVDFHPLSSNCAAYFPNSKSGSRSCSLYPAMRRNLFHAPARGATESKLDSEGTFSWSSSQAEDPVNLLDSNESSMPCSDSKATRHGVHTMNAHNIFEVPQNHENHKFCGSHKQERKKLISEGERWLEKPDSVLKGTAEYYSKDEAESVKKMLLCAHHEKNIFKLRDGITCDCHFSLFGPTIDVVLPQVEVQQLNKRLQILEDDRRIMTHEVSDRMEEKSELLSNLHEEELNTPQPDISSSNTTKCAPPDESPLVPITEAMLSLSL